MRNIWTSISWLLAAACVVRATHTHYAAVRCQCSGRSRYCLRDAEGLHCVDCQGNTEGRHCERCKAGFYLQGAGLSCTPCGCHQAGSVGAACDSSGRCSCKEGVSGDKCDLCPEGGANGCSQSRRPRQDSGSPPCFCYGHSSTCSPESGFSVHNITSTFATGTDGWTVATSQGTTPADVHFRWSPTHQDLEVISKNSLPVYLYAPASLLGNRLLSYGQNLSFSLRLDRGVRHPSTNDVILEGGGQRVSASLGDLRSIVPCGQKIHYSFRLDQQPGSRWRPQLSSLQFQTLLQNLTAVKIRATFGENGRGYLDNVKLVSAQRGDGAPARWVQTCACPQGYEGQFCERCSGGFRRRDPVGGAFGSCEPCSCKLAGGSCDPKTGECYLADETRADQSCSPGFYWDSSQTNCLSCPCPAGVSCSLAAGSVEPQCERCATGTTGPRCDACQEGFHGNPTGVDGVQRPCRPCQCHGHIDVGLAGSCDRSTGECLKCLNNTKGRSCEACVRGFYHSRVTDACKRCNCNLLGSESGVCDDAGRCRCRPGFEGLKCQRSDCPSCFSPIKTQMKVFGARLTELESRLSGTAGGLTPVDSALEAALKDSEQLVDDLQDNMDELLEMEKGLQDRLASISRSQLAKGQSLQHVEVQVDGIKQQQSKYKKEVDQVQTLVADLRRKMEEAKTKLKSVEFPVGDTTLGPDSLSALVRIASSLADKHQAKATDVGQAADDALSDSEKSLALVRGLVNRENKVKGLVGNLKTTFDQTSTRVQGLEDQAVRLSADAKAESKKAEDMLKKIVGLEGSLPTSLKEQMDAMVSRLDGLNGEVDQNILGLEVLQDGVQRDRTTTETLLAQGKAAQQDVNNLLDRVYVAKNDTEAALRRIGSNTRQLDDALNALRGFDQQIDGGKSLAEDAIRRLPGINATIQQAVRNNAETVSIMGVVNKDYSDALGTVDVLQGLVGGLEGTFGSLPSHGSLLKEATELNKDAKDLNVQAVDLAGDLDFELDGARRQEAEARQAADGAVGAFENAGQTRAAVGQTLRDISALLADMSQPGVAVDEGRLKQLEQAVARAKTDVEAGLRPRLTDMERKEDAMRRRLSSINRDIDTVLRDIANLEDILRTVPKGCYNSPPIEEP